MAKACPRQVYETQYRDVPINPLEGMKFERVQGQDRLIVPRDKTRFLRAKFIVR